MPVFMADTKRVGRLPGDSEILALSSSQPGIFFQCRFLMHNHLCRSLCVIHNSSLRFGAPEASSVKQVRNPA